MFIEEAITRLEQRVNGFWLIEDVEIKEVSNSFQSLLSNLGD